MSFDQNPLRIFHRRNYPRFTAQIRQQALLLLLGELSIDSRQQSESSHYSHAVRGCWDSRYLSQVEIRNNGHLEPTDLERESPIGGILGFCRGWWWGRFLFRLGLRRELHLSLSKIGVHLFQEALCDPSIPSQVPQYFHPDLSGNPIWF